MNLNQLIDNRLKENAELCKLLAKYAEKPAIFNTEFPPDQQAGWDRKNQYPRICYRVDMQANQERSSVGTLHIAVYSDKQSLVIEDIEEMVRRCLKDVLMKPSGEAPFCVSWARTDSYRLNGPAVICKDINFDILEYPCQETTNPDPVMAVSSFIKELYPNAIVLGIDNIEDYVNPADKPVFYCRLQEIQDTTGHCMHSISWFIGKVAVHLLYPDSSVRLKMTAAINQRMAVEEEIIMLDQSPMTIRNLTMNNKADYLREGQLFVTGKYGCLRGGEKKHKFEHVGSRLTK